MGSRERAKNQIEKILNEIESMADEAIISKTPISWNYRIVWKDFSFQIFEVYYDGNGDIILWSFPVVPYGDTAKELKRDLKSMKRAFELPILKMVGEDEMAKLVEWE